MGTIFTVAVYFFGALFFVYLVICEFLDTIGRLEIVATRWPRLYKAMSNRPMRLVLLVFLIALVGKDLAERAKEPSIPPIVAKIAAPPPPTIVFSSQRSQSSAQLGYDKLTDAIQALHGTEVILEEVDAQETQLGKERLDAAQEYRDDPESKTTALARAKEQHDLKIGEIKGRVDYRWQQISPSITNAFEDAQNWLKQKGHLTHNEAEDETKEFRIAMQKAKEGGADVKRFAELEKCLTRLRKTQGTYQ